MTGYGTPYSHVYIKIWSEKYERNLIYQASHTMVNFMGTELFEKENQIVQEFQIEIPDESKAKLMQFAIDSAGTLYGIKSVVGLAIQRIAELCGFKIKNPLADGTETYICCEMVGYILQNFASVNLPHDPNDITPAQIYDFMVSVAKSD